MGGSKDPSYTPGSTHPLPGSSHHPLPGPSHSQLNSSYPLPGSSHPKSGSANLLPESSHPQPGSSHPLHGSSHSDHGSSHNQPGPAHHQTGSSSQGGLSRSISMCNMDKTCRLRQTCRDDIRPGQAPFYLQYFQTMTAYLLILPPLRVMVKVIREKLQKLLFDEYIWTVLERARVINWCPTAKALYPKWTKGDGNCLLHAVSLYMWGIHDDPLFLRGLVHRALLEDQGRQDLRQRWMREKLYWNSTIPEGGLQLDNEEWEREWELVVNLAHDERQDHSPNTLPYRSLEEIHIFVLANTIRRPIIVLSEHVIRNIQGSSLAPNHVGGVYLPTLWHADDCVKSPVVLCYESNHFVPLLSMEDAPSSSPLAERSVHAVPVVTENLEILPVHFLSESEESQVSELFKKYLDLVELPWTKSDSVDEVLAARIHLNLRLPDEFYLVDDYYREVEKLCQEEMRCIERNKGIAVIDKTMPKTPLMEISLEELPMERNIRTCKRSPKEQDEIFEFYNKNLKELVNFKGGISKYDTDVVRKAKEELSKGTESVPLAVEAKHWKYQEGKSCITEGCDYFGLPESGGRCSACIIEFTKENQSNISPLYDPKTPSAPTVKRTGSFQGYNRSFSEDTTSMFAEISAIGDKVCVYPSCYLQSSRLTAPYCMKHKDKGTIFSSRIRDKDRDVASYYARDTLELPTEGRCESNSLESIVMEFPKMCIIPRCQRTGDQRYDNKCCLHFFTEEPRDLKEGSSLPFEQSKNQEKGVMEFEKLCRNLRCTRSGEPQWKGYCEHCVKTVDLSTKEMNIESHVPKALEYSQRNESNGISEYDRLCKNIRCSRSGASGLQGYCEDCFSNLDIAQNLQNEQRLKLLNGSSSEGDRQKTPERPKSWAVAKSNYGDKMLEKQEDERNEKLVEKVRNTETSSHQPPSKRHIVNTKLSNLDQSSSAVPPKSSKKRSKSRGEWREPIGAIPDVNDVEFEAIRQCTKPGCSGIQALNNSGLCWVCIKLSLRAAAPGPPTPSTTLINTTTSSHQPPIPGGVTTTAGSQAYTYIPAGATLSTHQRMDTTTSTTTSYIPNTMTTSTTLGQELLTRKKQEKCVRRQCDRIGIDANRGLCSECAIELQSQGSLEESPPPLSSSSSSTSSTGDRYSMTNDMRRQPKCINPSCDNKGMEINKGLCQDCFNYLATKDSTHTNRAIYPSGSRDWAVLKKCLGVTCDMYGTTERDGYCSKCFLQRSSTRRLEPGLPVSPPAHYEPTGASITANPCYNHHCSRFGDPAFNGFCSACYADYGYNYDTEDIPGTYPMTHTSASDYHRPSVASIGLTPSIQSSIIRNKRYNDPLSTDITRCRNRRYTGCNNFSHYNCKGFCRGCYVTIRSSIH